MGNYIYIIIGVLILLWIVGTWNSIRSLDVKVDEALSGIDVQLERRYDLLDNLFRTAKGYAKHEKEILLAVTAYRKGMSVDEMSEVNAGITQGFEQVAVVAENYPELKANSVFLKLQKEATHIEEELQAARRLYNSNVSIYNRKIVVIPNNIIAMCIRATKKNFFKAEEAKKKNYQIEF